MYGDKKNIEYKAQQMCLSSQLPKMVDQLMDILYANIPARRKEDRMAWRLKGNNIFDVHSYYEALRGNTGVFFP